MLGFTSVLGSLYLGYILYFVLQEICPVCVSTYVVNFILFITSFCKLRGLSSAGRRASEPSKRRVQSPRDGLAFKKYI